MQSYKRKRQLNDFVHFSDKESTQMQRTVLESWQRNLKDKCGLIGTIVINHPIKGAMLCLFSEDDIVLPKETILAGFQPYIVLTHTQYIKDENKAFRSHAIVRNRGNQDTKDYIVYLGIYSDRREIAASNAQTAADAANFPCFAKDKSIICQIETKSDKQRQCVENKFLMTKKETTLQKGHLYEISLGGVLQYNPEDDVNFVPYESIEIKVDPKRQEILKDNIQKQQRNGELSTGLNFEDILTQEQQHSHKKSIKEYENRCRQIKLVLEHEKYLPKKKPKISEPKIDFNQDEPSKKAKVTQGVIITGKSLTTSSIDDSSVNSATSKENDKDSQQKVEKKQKEYKKNSLFEPFNLDGSESSLLPLKTLCIDECISDSESIGELEGKESETFKQLEILEKRDLLDSHDDIDLDQIRKAMDMQLDCDRSNHSHKPKQRASLIEKPTDLPIFKVKNFFKIDRNSFESIEWKESRVQSIQMKFKLYKEINKILNNYSKEINIRLNEIIADKDPSDSILIEKIKSVKQTEKEIITIKELMKKYEERTQSSNILMEEIHDTEQEINKIEHSYIKLRSELDYIFLSIIQKDLGSDILDEENNPLSIALFKLGKVKSSLLEDADIIQLVINSLHTKISSETMRAFNEYSLFIRSIKFVAGDYFSSIDWDEIYIFSQSLLYELNSFYPTKKRKWDPFLILKNYLLLNDLSGSPSYQLTISFMFKLIIPFFLLCFDTYLDKRIERKDLIFNHKDLDYFVSNTKSIIDYYVHQHSQITSMELSTESIKNLIQVIIERKIQTIGCYLLYLKTSSVNIYSHNRSIPHELYPYLSIDPSQYRKFYNKVQNIIVKIISSLKRNDIKLERIDDCGYCIDTTASSDRRNASKNIYDLLFHTLQEIFKENNKYVYFIIDFLNNATLNNVLSTFSLYTYLESMNIHKLNSTITHLYETHELIKKNIPSILTKLSISQATPLDISTMNGNISFLVSNERTKYNELGITGFLGSIEPYDKKDKILLLLSLQQLLSDCYRLTKQAISKKEAMFFPWLKLLTFVNRETHAIEKAASRDDHIMILDPRNIHARHLNNQRECILVIMFYESLIKAYEDKPGIIHLDGSNILSISKEYPFDLDKIVRKSMQLPFFSSIVQFFSMSYCAQEDNPNKEYSYHLERTIASIFIMPIFQCIIEKMTSEPFSKTPFFAIFLLPTLDSYIKKCQSDLIQALVEEQKIIKRENTHFTVAMKEAIHTINRKSTVARIKLKEDNFLFNSLELHIQFRSPQPASHLIFLVDWIKSSLLYSEKTNTIDSQVFMSTIMFNINKLISAYTTESFSTLSINMTLEKNSPALYVYQTFTFILKDIEKIMGAFDLTKSEINEPIYKRIAHRVLRHGCSDGLFSNYFNKYFDKPSHDLDSAFRILSLDFYTGCLTFCQALDLDTTIILLHTMDIFEKLYSLLNLVERTDPLNTIFSQYLLIPAINTQYIRLSTGHKDLSKDEKLTSMIILIFINQIKQLITNEAILHPNDENNRTITIEDKDNQYYQLIFNASNGLLLHRSIFSLDFFTFGILDNEYSKIEAQLPLLNQINKELDNLFSTYCQIQPNNSHFHFFYQAWRLNKIIRIDFIKSVYKSLLIYMIKLPVMPLHLINQLLKTTINKRIHNYSSFFKQQLTHSSQSHRKSQINDKVFDYK